MEKDKIIKYVSIALSIYLIICLTLFFMKKIPPLVFWISAIVIGILAYKVLPSLRK